MRRSVFTQGARCAPPEPGPGANVGFPVISCVELREQLREYRLKDIPAVSQEAVRSGSRENSKLKGSSELAREMGEGGTGKEVQRRQ